MFFFYKFAIIIYIIISLIIYQKNVTGFFFTLFKFSFSSHLSISLLQLYLPLLFHSYNCIYASHFFVLVVALELQHVFIAFVVLLSR